MGLFFKKTKTFSIDKSKTEYENWLDFLETGGTTAEWNKLKAGVKFAKDDTKKFIRYQAEVRNVSDSYYKLMGKINCDWSVLRNLNDYNCKLAKRFENDCLKDISLYLKMREIDMKYGEKTPTNVPAFKRLCMLYEKQERYEEAVSICKQAISVGVDERSRMLRMIKKAGRTPTDEEIKTANNAHTAQERR